MRPLSLFFITLFIGLNAFAGMQCLKDNMSQDISTQALLEICSIDNANEARLVYRFCTEVRGGSSQLCKRLTGYGSSGSIGGDTSPSKPEPTKPGRKPGRPSEAYCEENPNRIGCEQSEAYCEQNPARIGCEKSEAYCRSNPNRIGCEKSEAYCVSNPNRIGCEKSEAYCRQNPNRIGCEQSEAYCEQNPNRIGCEHSEAYCRQNPHRIGCSGN